MPCGSTSGTAARMSRYSSSAAVLYILPWMTTCEVRMCTHLKGKDSWFLPFNQGWNNGAGNPPNPNGLKTDYLWKRIPTKPGLTDILENYAEIVEEKDERGRKKHPKQIFPRFHQLDVVRKLLADATARGAGERYLIQHSAGSGKRQLHRLAGPSVDWPGGRRQSHLRHRRGHHVPEESPSP